MAHPTYKEVTGGATRSRKASGVGSDADPHVLHNNVDAIAAGANRIGKVTLRNTADAADIDPLAEATFTGTVGAVTGSPTANTLLARLKDLLSLIVLAAGGNSIGGVKDNGPHYTPNAPFIMSNADVSSAAQNITPAPDTGELIVVDDLVISVSTTAEVFIIEEDTLTEVFRAFILANQPFVWSPRNRLRGLTIEKQLMIKTVAAAPIRTTALTHSEA